MPAVAHKKKLTRQAKWFKEHGMTSIGLHGATYRKFDKLRRAASRDRGVKLLSWNEFILILIVRMTGKHRRPPPLPYENGGRR
jgi:hypothetical protein